VTGRMWVVFLLGAVELVLILPGLTGMAILAVQWWAQRVWRYLAIDDYLNAMVYPFVGAAAGALAAIGLASGLASNGQKGLGWVVASMAIIVMASVVAAQIRRSQVGVPQRFSPNDRELEVKILAGRLYLSAAERQFFERRAAEDELEAKRLTEEADGLTWTGYWRTRSRRMRFLARCGRGRSARVAVGQPVASPSGTVGRRAPNRRRSRPQVSARRWTVRGLAADAGSG
jgi:hypothetical protein